TEPRRHAIGLHYRAAEVWDRAAPALYRAGRTAAGRSAHREAATCFEHALEGLAHCPESGAATELGIDVRVGLSQAYYSLARYDRALEVAREAGAPPPARSRRGGAGWARLQSARALGGRA